MGDDRSKAKNLLPGVDLGETRDAKDHLIKIKGSPSAMGHIHLQNWRIVCESRHFR